MPEGSSPNDTGQAEPNADDLAECIVQDTDPLESPRHTTYDLAAELDTSTDVVREKLRQYDWAHPMDDDEIEWAFDRQVVFSESIAETIQSYPDRYAWSDFNVGE